MISTSNIVERPKGRLINHVLGSFLKYHAPHLVVFNKAVCSVIEVDCPILTQSSCAEFTICHVVSLRHLKVRLYEQPSYLTADDTYSTSYGAAEVGVATANTPCGPYTYKASWKPLGADSRDMSLYQDGESFSLIVTDW